MKHNSRNTMKRIFIVLQILLGLCFLYGIMVCVLTPERTLYGVSCIVSSALSSVSLFIVVYLMVLKG